MLALEILNERLIDLERIFKMYQSTQVQMDINETKEAIDELEALQQRSCDGCIRLPFILIELAKRDGGKCGTCKRFVKDHYELEPKEQ